MLKILLTKINIKLILIFTIFFNPHVLLAAVEELKSIKSFPKVFKKDIWIVLDLDDTVFTTSSMLASGTVNTKIWMKNKLKLDENKFNKLYHNLIISSPSTVEDYNSQIYRDIVEIGDNYKKLVEVEIVDFIHIHQQNGMKIIALTSRKNDDLNLWQELQKYDIDFSKSFPYMKDFELSSLEKPTILADNKFYPEFSKGIIFTDLADKGQALLTFIRSIGVSPTQIFFIDNALEHCLSVDKVSSITNIDITSFHYSAAERLFNENLANIEFKYFLENKILLTDFEASTLMQ